MTLLLHRLTSNGTAALVGLALLGSACSNPKGSPVGPGASTTPGNVTTTIPAVVPSGVAGHGWYAAPSGSAGGDGTATKPWDLQTALNGGNGKVQAADTILLTVPSQLGVAYNAAMLETIARDVAPAIGWSPDNSTEPIG